MSTRRHPTLFDASCIAGFILVTAWLTSIGLLGGWQ